MATLNALYRCYIHSPGRVRILLSQFPPYNPTSSSRLTCWESTPEVLGETVLRPGTGGGETGYEIVVGQTCIVQAGVLSTLGQSANIDPPLGAWQISHHCDVGYSLLGEVC